MGTALAAGAALGGRELARMSGEWSDMTSRIRIATENLDYHGDATARLAEIADRTYSSLSLTAENWLLNAQALAEYGYGAEAGLDFTEALNNALVVSAARGQRAETVINAMARGLALGELRGNEFNTVIMNGGRVTQALADALGITTGELREMAREGRLSTHVVVDAMISQMERLRAEAESMPATIEDAGVRTGTAILTLTGRLDELTGTSRAVAAEIIAIADAIKAAADDPEALAALAAQLETVWAAAQFIAGVALVRWLAGVAVQARASAAAWLMKSEAAAISGRNAAAAAATEAAAVTGLRGAIMAAAQARLTAAAPAGRTPPGGCRRRRGGARGWVELALASTSARSAAADETDGGQAALTAAQRADRAARGGGCGAHEELPGEPDRQRRGDGGDAFGRRRAGGDAGRALGGRPDGGGRRGLGPPRIHPAAGARVRFRDRGDHRSGRRAA
ncbi:MAG: tape measure protein [Maricaulaceae bacterium]|nr:tape measure protein [Maricaulaceae bacterium]